MSEELHIHYDQWIESFDRMVVAVKEIVGNSTEPQLFNFVAGEEPLSKVLSLKCHIPDCEKLDITIVFPEEGTYLFPLPFGWRFAKEESDVESEFGPRKTKTH